MQKFATEMDKLALTAMPGMTTAVDTMTTGLLAAATEMNKMVAMGPEAYMKSLTDDKIDPNASALDKQDTRNTNAMGAGAKFSNYLSKALGENLVGLFSSSAAKSIKERRVAQQTVQQQNKLGDKANVGEAYKEQYGSQMGDAKKLMDRMRAMQYGGTQNYNPLKTAGPASNLKGDSFSSSVSSVVATSASTSSQSGGTTSTTTSNSIQEEQVVVLKEIANQMARSNSTNEEILQATRQ